MVVPRYRDPHQVRLLEEVFKAFLISDHEMDDDLLDQVQNQIVKIH